ncbi:MAG: CNNM domain-containing protein [Fibrobacterota bacterium]
MLLLWGFLFGLSFLLSFLFAGFETGFISWNSLKIEHRADRGDPVARIARSMERRAEQVITTVLLGNNIALVAMSTSAEILLAASPFHVPDALMNLGLTAVVLVFCELLPKSLFRIYSFRMSYLFVPLVFPFFLFFYPLSLLFKVFSRGSGEAVKNRELVAIAREGERDRGLMPFTRNIVSSVVKKRRRSLREVAASLKPCAVLDKTMEGRSPAASAVRASLQAGQVLTMEDSVESVLCEERLISSEFIVIQDGARYFAYKNEDWFRKLFYEE